METLRRVVRWIARHRIFSLLLLAAALSAFFYARTVYVRSQGALSEPLARGSIVESVYGIGTVMALRSHQLRAGVTSTIYDLYVNEGASVKKGAKLINIDGVVYHAPFDGTVTSVPFKMGENIFASQSVLTIVDLRDRYAVVSLEQQAALRVRPGLPVKLSFDTQRDRAFEGAVESVYSNETGFLARIVLKELPENILPGMTADVAITIREKNDVLLAPVAALEEGRYVWVKRPRELAKREEVSVGIIDKAMAEVEGGGVRAGDRVLLRAHP